MRDRKAVIAHDYFAIRGGGERLVLTMAEALGADLAFGYRVRDETYEDELFPESVRDLGLCQPLQRPTFRPAALALRFSATRSLLAQYDVRVFSGAAAPFAAPANAGGQNIYYCHTPPRFLYDQREHFASRVETIPKRWAMDLFQHSYEKSIARMDLIVANSETVRQRVKRFLGRDAIVIYPPCKIEAYNWEEPNGYYLSTARLSPLKRVNLIVEAFLQLPHLRLVVASQGEELQALKAIAGSAKNISFVGWTDDRRLRQLISGAIATVYVPVDEDFGMSPVESMAAGKPVIGVAEGGLRETIVHGETGILLRPGFGVDDLVEAVLELPAEKARRMRASCQARAAVFSEARFIAAIREVIDD